MDALNQEFIEKTKKHENDFLNANIKIQSVEDWNQLKETIFHLGDLYIEESNNNILVKHCQDYLRIMWQSIHKIEEKYQNKLTEENLKAITYQLRILCLFNSCTSYRQELAENYTLESSQNSRNIPYIDVSDILNKEYRIKVSDYKTFQDSCKSQKELYNKYIFAYTIIYGTREEKLRLLMEDYKNDAEGLRKKFLTGKITITNRVQWNLLKERINAFRINCDSLRQNLKETENFQVMRNSFENFINLICDFIVNIEKRYNDNMHINDFPNIIENLHIICKYNFLNEEKDKIIYTASKIQKKSTSKIEVQTSKGVIVHIDEESAELWKQLDQEQKKVEEKYQEAYEFAFGKKEKEEKRGI